MLEPFIHDHEIDIKDHNLTAFYMTIVRFARIKFIVTDFLFNIHEHKKVLELLRCSP